jgi:hypothetical protein
MVNSPMTSMALPPFVRRALQVNMQWWDNRNAPLAQKESLQH